MDVRDAMLPRQAARAGALLGVALACWIVAVQRMWGMDAGPGTDPGAFVWFIGLWVTMMAAMMLPAAAPAALLYARIRAGAPTSVFVLGYLLAWTAYGVAAYAVYRGLREAAPSFAAWDERGPWLAGGALVAAGLYQLTPLKTACLHHCRSPLHFLLGSRAGIRGAVRTGFVHGGYCVGCCTGLMVALFALGIMSLFWMAVVAAAIVVEKVLPGGEAFARVLAVVLIACGIWVATAPRSVPGLVQPDAPQMMMQP